MRTGNPLFFFSIAPKKQYDFEISWILVDEKDHEILRRQYAVKFHSATLEFNNEGYFSKFVLEELKRTITFYKPIQVFYNASFSALFTRKTGFNSGDFSRAVNIEKLAKEKGLNGFSSITELLHKIDHERKVDLSNTLRQAEQLRYCYFTLIQRNLSPLDSVKKIVGSPYRKLKNIWTRNTAPDNQEEPTRPARGNSKEEGRKKVQENKGADSPGCLKEIWDIIWNLFLLILQIYLILIVIGFVANIIRWLIGLFL